VAIEVVKPGLLTTLQDLGRAGHAHLGIGRAGAFDVPAMRIANALCGNPGDACGLEMTLLGPTLRFDAGTWIAVTGAPMAIDLEGTECPMWAPVFVPAGASVTLGAVRAGCRSYLGVGGGVDVEPVLGSRSTDLNAELGPHSGRPLGVGDTLASGTDTGDAEPATPKWRLDPRPWYFEDSSKPLRLLPGNHLDRLTTISLKQLFSDDFTVRADSNRVGVRLAGPTIECSAPIEMISEGCVPGLLQLPPSGQPIAFGPECPVSGGYPRLGTIAAVDIPRLAQLRPGDALRFRACTMDEASDALRKRERALDELEAAIRHRLSRGDRH
jgi:antagonist of KipI